MSGWQPAPTILALWHDRPWQVVLGFAIMCLGAPLLLVDHAVSVRRTSVRRDAAISIQRAAETHDREPEDDLPRPVVPEGEYRGAGCHPRHPRASVRPEPSRRLRTDEMIPASMPTAGATQEIHRRPVALAAKP